MAELTRAKSPGSDSTSSGYSSSSSSEFQTYKSKKATSQDSLYNVVGAEAKKQKMREWLLRQEREFAVYQYLW